MGNLHLWSTFTGKRLLRLPQLPTDEGTFGSHSFSFSPDGKTLATGNGAKIHLLDVSTGKVFRTLKGHSGEVRAITFSPNGQLLASGSADRTVRLWEVQAEGVSECRRFCGHDAEVTAVAFSPDGRRLASSSHDSTAILWDVTDLFRRQMGVTGPTGRQSHVARLTQRELTTYWQSLASTGATEGETYQALRALAAVPDQAVPFLAERLLVKKPKKTDPQLVSRLLADLDSEDFRVRSQATKDLKKLGEAAESALRQALKDNPSVEVRRRIQELLEAIAPEEEVTQRRLRAVEVLAWIGTSAARELLEKLAADPPQEEVGLEAKAALRRLRHLARP